MGSSFPGLAIPDGDEIDLSLEEDYPHPQQLVQQIKL